MGCCFKPKRSQSERDADNEAARSDNQNQPLIDQKGEPGSPNSRKKKGKTRTPAQVNPFNKPRKYQISTFDLSLNLLYYVGGVVVEKDENDQLVAKPYNINEAVKQKALEEEDMPKQSLAAASVLA